MNKRETDLINRALRVMEKHGVQYRTGEMMDSPVKAKDYLRLRLGAEKREVFGVMFLNAQHQTIATKELFFGTLTQTAVYPREVARIALEYNAAAVVLYHNHPSGNPEPSRADEHLTDALRKTLCMLDINVLDHLVITAGTTVSFAERGLL